MKSLFMLSIGMLFASTTVLNAAEDYYPTAKGTEWTYKVGEATITVKVTDSSDKGAKLETIVNKKTVATETILVKEDGIYRTQINNDDVEPPVKILELKDGKPVEKGTSWDIKSSIKDQSVEGKFTVTALDEKVTVGDKEYPTVVVDGPDFKIAQTNAGIKAWYAKDVGIVKLVIHDRRQPRHPRIARVQSGEVVECQKGVRLDYRGDNLT